MHLADAFIQSDLHCIQVTVSTFYQLLFSLGIEPMILALLAPCSTSWATGNVYTFFSMYKILIVFFCQVYSQVAQDPFLFLFRTSSPVQSSFTHAAATNQHFWRLLGKRCACLTVSSRKWTHADLSLQAQKEIWSCASLISLTTEFEGKQAAFRLRTMLYCSRSCTQLIV